MSTTSIQSGTPLEQLARTIFTTYDTNADQKLSDDEFSRLISGLTGTLVSTATTSSGNAVTTPLLPAARAVRSRIEGFDLGKLANVDHRTPKYIFARVAQYADLSGVRDKATAESVLTSMVDDLRAAGLDVLGVSGDKLKVAIEGREDWIDVIRGANGGSPAFQWLPVE